MTSQEALERLKAGSWVRLPGWPVESSLRCIAHRNSLPARHTELHDGDLFLIGIDLPTLGIYRNISLSDVTPFEFSESDRTVTDWEVVEKPRYQWARLVADSQPGEPTHSL